MAYTLTWNTHGNACKNYKGSANSTHMYKRVRGAEFWVGGSFSLAFFGVAIA